MERDLIMAKCNKVFLLGSLCSEVEYRVLPKSGISYAKYQMAINREKNKGTDYPYICSFGKQAENDATYLQKGSQVLIQGRVQTREFEQTVECPHCEQEFSKQGIATEIVADNVEYLNNCLFPKKEEKEEEKAE